MAAAAGDPLTPSSGEPPLPPSLRLASDRVADADSPTATIPTCWGNALCFLSLHFLVHEWEGTRDLRWFGGFW